MSYVKKALSAHEHILLRSRKHPIVLLWPFSYNLVLLIILVSAIISALVEEPELVSATVLLSLVVFPFLLFLYSCVKWWFQEYYLTTNRVISAEGIINKRMSDSSLDKVTDVVLFQSWIGRILNYGDVNILTASEAGANKFWMLESPVKFKKAMLNQKEVLEAEENQGAARKAGDSNGRVSDLISGLDVLRKKGVVTEKEFSDKKTNLLAQM